MNLSIISTLLVLLTSIQPNIFNLDRAKILVRCIDLNLNLKTNREFRTSIKIKKLNLKFKDIKISIGINF